MVMVTNVLRITTHQGNVVRGIIHLVFVIVMSNLMRFKISTKFLFKNMAMKQHVSSLRCVRMISHANVKVFADANRIT